MDPTQQQPTGDPERLKELEVILDKIRPMLRGDGGDIQLVSEDDGFVSVRLTGACCGCQGQAMTLQGAIEPMLSQHLEWFKGLRSA